MGCHQFVRFAIQQQPAFINDDHAVANALDHVQDVRAIDNGFAFAREGLNQRFETDGGVGVEAVQRFVEKNHGRVVQQRGGDDHLAPHAFRVSAEQFVRQRFETEVEESDELLDAWTRDILRNPVERRDHFEIFKSTQRFKHRA